MILGESGTGASPPRLAPRGLAALAPAPLAQKPGQKAGKARRPAPPPPRPAAAAGLRSLRAYSQALSLSEVRFAPAFRASRGRGSKTRRFSPKRDQKIVKWRPSTRSFVNRLPPPFLPSPLLMPCHCRTHPFYCAAKRPGPPWTRMPLVLRGGRPPSEALCAHISHFFG